MIKKVIVSQAEGRIEDTERNKNLQFPNLNEAERFIETQPRRERGYDKWDIELHKNDKFERLRYDHGRNDPPLTKQISGAIVTRVFGRKKK